MQADIIHIQNQFNEGLKNMGNLQKDMQKMAQDKQKLIEQLNECEIVLAEVSLVEEGAKCYKQIGPCLVKQNIKEIQQNINKRLEMIKNEVAKVNVLLKDNEQKQQALKNKVNQLQEIILKFRQSMQQK